MTLGLVVAVAVFEALLTVESGDAHCRILRLDDNGLTDGIPSTLGSLTALQ
jgi:hypothetical protein